ncbi:hypothetical protein GCM10027188_17390 [Lysobacter humi (ex Lee et al. 2017)]
MPLLAPVTSTEAGARRPAMRESDGAIYDACTLEDEGRNTARLPSSDRAASHPVWGGRDGQALAAIYARGPSTVHGESGQHYCESSQM